MQNVQILSLPLLWFLRKMFLIPAVQFSKYNQVSQILDPLRGPVSMIPENDTVKEELQSIRPSSSEGFSPDPSLSAFADRDEYRPEIKLRIPASLRSLERR